MTKNVFLHADMDAFFASVEQRDNPELRGKPVIVGGKPNEMRSVVSTASYEARAFGVHSAMSSSRAFQLCPQGIFIKPRIKHYQKVSAEIMEIFSHYSPDVFQMSIDEALIDLTGMEKIFGNPVNAARKIKQEVWEKTHLTISLGLATTRYIAKIASGLKKPNGLTVVPRGKEQDFILSLPLEKLWGLGKKTLDKVHASGILTTRDLHDTPLSLLQTNFGKACGLFLFNASHALEVDTFASKPLKHSVSAERTFPFDLINKDAINAKLMELANEVMFRLYNENKTGKTVGIKVRYDDFTTVNAQITMENYVSSSDDLYFKVKKLFWDKVNPAKPIRLLGVNVQNVENEVKNQEELFDFGDEKKKKLDRVIFELQKKDSSIKIVKASILAAANKSIFPLIFSLFLLNFFSFSLNAQTKLMSKDENVEFDISGYWNSQLEVQAGMTKEGENVFEEQASTPVFTQDVDMSMYFLVNRMWFFEADFKDEFNENTIAAGYIGNGVLKEAKVANRGIEFPKLYSINLFHNISGGKNEAPGVSLHFEGENWQADSVFRYDLVKAKTKTFYGNVAEEEKNIDLSDFARGYCFVLPEEAIFDVKDVYIEDDSGTYTVKKRRFKKLSADSYIISRSEKMIILSSDVKSGKNELNELPCVLVSFNNQDENSLLNIIGSYEDENSFLGDVQKWFFEAENQIALQKYSYNYIEKVENDVALRIQNSTGFSPFAVNCFYSIENTEFSDVKVISESTKSESSIYLAEIVSDISDNNREFIEIYQKNSEDDMTKSSVRFPFADKYPEIYLNSSKKCDLVVQTTAYNEVTSYYIGKNASSVMVYVNGVLDSLAKYDENDGNVQPSLAISPTDKVYIVYYEENGYSTTGSFALASGFSYKFSENFDTDLSFAASYAYSAAEKYADSLHTSPAYAGLATATHWKSENEALKLSFAAGISAESANTTNLYRILGGNSDECETISIAKNAAKALPEDFEPQINARSDDNSASQFALPLELSAKQKDSSLAQLGERDSAISGYAIPILWDFSGLSASTFSPAWTATTIDLGKIATTLASAETFSIALRCDTAEKFASADDKIEIFLQLGVNTDENFVAEDTEAIPTWLISKKTSPDVIKSFDLCEDDWQTITVRLCDEDKARLGVYTGARILVVTSDTASVAAGKISAGVFEIAQSTFTATSTAYKTILREDTLRQINAEWGLTAENLDNATVEKFNTKQNIISALHWETDSAQTSSDSSIKITRYVEQTDLANYKSFSFYYYFVAGNAKCFSFDFTRDDENAISFSLSSEELGEADSWHKVEVNLLDKSVYVDSAKTSERAEVDIDVIASKIAITLDAEGTDEGYFFIDELHLSESLPVYSVQDSASASYDIAGAILSLGEMDLLHDLSLTATSNSTFGTKNFVSQSANAKIGVNKFDIAMNETTRNDSKYFFSAIGHSLCTNDSLFSIIDIKESFQSDNENKKATKIDEISLSAEPISLNICAKSSSTALNKTQNTKLSIESDSERLHFDTETTFYQKTASIYCANYSENYADNSKIQFSTGEAEAKKRKSSSKASLSYLFEPLSFKPEITASAADTYTASSSAKQSEETAFQITLPFTINKQLFSLSYKREGGSTRKTSAGGEYKSDIENIAYSGRNYFYKAIIVNDLFSERLASDMLKQSSDSTQFYNASYEADWKRANYYTLADFFLPSAVKTSFARQITASSTQSDIYTAKASVIYSAFNIFGSYSALHLFSWYTQDEIYTLLSTSAKIPRSNPAEYTLTSSASFLATLTLNKSDSVKSALEGTFEDAYTWSAKGSLSYKRKRKDSPIVSFVKIFSPNLDTREVYVIRTDGIKAAFSEKKTSSTTNAKIKKTQSVIYTHSSEVAFSKLLKVNASVSPEFSRSNEKIYLGVSATLGAKLSF